MFNPFTVQDLTSHALKGLTHDVGFTSKEIILLALVK